jgi:hypothetical protein
MVPGAESRFSHNYLALLRFLGAVFVRTSNNASN